MFVYNLIIICVAISPAVSSVARDKINSCSSDEFSCLAWHARTLTHEPSCVSVGAVCDGVRDCSDGSDEASCSTGSSSPQSGKCILPPYPEHGTYEVDSAPDAKPGQNFSDVRLNVTCRPGYGVFGTNIVFCQNGIWTHYSIPECVRICTLDRNPSVYYRCLIPGLIEDYRTCANYEASGTVVRPECNTPNYYSADPLPFMRCINGSWDYVAVCTPGLKTEQIECGRVTPGRVARMIGGRPAKRGEQPWHVGIYRKRTTPYVYICGGSLVSDKVVISVANCFWGGDSKLLPATNYAVAAGKIYRPYNNDQDVGAQKSDVKEIHIPALFLGSAANFQDDIAIVIVQTAFIYQTFIRPVCLDFDINFDRRQLQPGNLGKVAGWGLTAENGNASQVLNVVELPYVDIRACIDASPPSFRGHISGDKICAGYGNGTALCKGDGGGGLAFPESEGGTDRYYLRGIVSTSAAHYKNLCNSHSITTFTQIIKHEYFIKKYV